MTKITTSNPHGFIVGDIVSIDPFTMKRLNVLQKIFLKIKYFFVSYPTYKITDVTETNFTVDTKVNL